MPQPTRTIRAYETATPLSLDGDLAKWEGAESVAFEGRPLADHPRRATVYALWDRDYLYLGFDVFSSKLVAAVRAHDGDLLWEDDGVEFLIDANHDRSKEWLADDFFCREHPGQYLFLSLFSYIKRYHDNVRPQPLHSNAQVLLHPPHDHRSR